MRGLLEVVRGTSLQGAELDTVEQAIYACAGVQPYKVRALTPRVGTPGDLAETLSLRTTCRAKKKQPEEALVVVQDERVKKPCTADCYPILRPGESSRCRSAGRFR